MNPIPEKIINFRVYLNGTDLLGIADAELPSIEAMTDAVKGAGIAGEVDSPVLGHFSSMTLKLTWRTVTGNTTILAMQQAHHLDLRGAIQVYNAGLGLYETQALKVVCRAVPKKTSLGKLDVGTKQDAEQEFEVNFLLVSIAGTERILIDKYNFFCIINGIDYLAGVRENLGL